MIHNSCLILLTLSSTSFGVLPMEEWIGWHMAHKLLVHIRIVHGHHALVIIGTRYRGVFIHIGSEIIARMSSSYTRGVLLWNCSTLSKWRELNAVSGRNIVLVLSFNGRRLNVCICFWMRVKRHRSCQC